MEGGFSVTVKKNALSAPLLESTDVSSIEIRDENGNLDVLFILIPGRPVAILTSADDDKHFAENCKNLGFSISKPKK